MKTSAQRRERILEHLEANSFAAVEELAREMDCSAVTIRRDLALMESRGMLERSHGGAAATRRVRLEFAVEEKSRVERERKIAIGKAAAKLIQPGQRVILDTGTTILALARELRGRENISVVTTSLAVVSALLSSKGVECMILGGVVRESSPDLYGPLVEENLSRIHADWAFVGCDGLTSEGDLTTEDPRVARATDLIISRAANVGLVTDSTKASRPSFYRFAHIDDLNYLITDPGMPEGILNAARVAEVEVITAEESAH